MFVMVNAGDGAGRKAENVQRVRALFLDLDTGGAESLKRVLEHCVARSTLPACVVESSPGKFHVYWAVRDCPPAGFGALQKALAATFGGDPAVSDLPRVMRLPGSLHRTAEPFQVRVLYSAAAYQAVHSVEQIVSAFDLTTTAPGAIGTVSAAGAPHTVLDRCRLPPGDWRHRGRLSPDPGHPRFWRCGARTVVACGSVSPGPLRERQADHSRLV